MSFQTLGQVNKNLVATLGEKHDNLLKGDHQQRKEKNHTEQTHWTIVIKYLTRSDTQSKLALEWEFIMIQQTKSKNMKRSR